MIRRPLALLLASAAAACGRAAPSAGAVADSTRARETPAAPRPVDSLVLRTKGGAEVWFTFARADTSVAGTPCLERTLEIREGARRVAVPLLYTGAAPVLLNDSTIRADIWVRCAPTERYRIDLRTGTPTAEARR